MAESEGKLRVLLITFFPMLIATLSRFIRLILRRALAHALSTTRSQRSARLEGWGGPMVRDAAHEAADCG
jgi:hypothetical protein